MWAWAEVSGGHRERGARRGSVPPRTRDVLHWQRTQRGILMACAAEGAQAPFYPMYMHVHVHMHAGVCCGVNV